MIGLSRRSAKREGGVVLAVLLTPALCAAQAAPSSPELVTDRPGFGESSGVVARGTLQVESGFTLEQAEHAHRDGTGQVLARVGVAPRLELRVASDGADAELGGKVKVLDADRAHVDVAVIPYLSIAKRDDGAGRAHDPGFKIAGSLTLPHGVGLSSTFNTADASGDAGRAWHRELSVSLDREFGRIGAFGEIDDACGDGCGASIDGGLTVAVGMNAQLDVEAGRGVHGPAQDWFVGAGFVIRAPIRARRR